MCARLPVDASRAKKRKEKMNLRMGNCEKVRVRLRHSSAALFLLANSRTRQPQPRWYPTLEIHLPEGTAAHAADAEKTGGTIPLRRALRVRRGK
jgi:hypothetical protein